MTFFCNLLRSGNLPPCLALENGPHQVPRKRAFSWVSQRKLDTWWGPFSGANLSGKLALRWFPPIFSLNIKLPFRDIDGATPTHSPKSGCKCPIDGATPSYLPTSINQLNQNMPHRSELSQDRRQNHQEKHQSYPSLILANEWELSHLCPKKAAWCWEKIWGETSAEDCKKYLIFWDIDGSTGLF